MGKHCDCQSDEGRNSDCYGGCGCGGSCDCCGQDGYFERRYQTKAEKIADLEEYLSELKTELQAVEEHLADLRK
jgi:hypothetical protein